MAFRTCQFYPGIGYQLELDWYNIPPHLSYNYLSGEINAE